jgi:hypothetical protein
MRTFILRRVELLAQGVGDVTLVGSNHSADTGLRNSSLATATLTPT